MADSLKGYQKGLGALRPRTGTGYIVYPKESDVSYTETWLVLFPAALLVTGRQGPIFFKVKVKCVETHCGRHAPESNAM